MTETTLQSQIDRLHRRILMATAPALIATIDDSGPIQTAQIRINDTPEIIDGVPVMQFYGFSAVAPTGDPNNPTDATALFVTGQRANGVIVATNNQQARLQNQQPGELAMYSDEGDTIALNRGNQINVNSKDTVTLTGQNNVNVKTDKSNIQASTSVTLDTPTTQAEGDLKAKGLIDAAGGFFQDGVPIGSGGQGEQGPPGPAGPQGPPGPAGPNWLVGTGLTLDGTTTPATLDLTIPVSIAHGGTNATTAAAALANLGGAPLASPAFTGIPTAPTPGAGDNSTTLATTAFVDTAVAAATAGGPFLPLAGGTLTGALIISAGGMTVSGPETHNNNVNFQALANFNANVDFDGASVTFEATTIPTWSGTPSGPSQLTNKTYVDSAIAAAVAGGPFLPLAGGTLTGTLTITTGGLLVGNGTGSWIEVNRGTGPAPGPVAGVVFQGLMADGTVTRASLETFGASAGSALLLRAARGTAAAMTPVQAGDELGHVTFSGCNTAGAFPTVGTNQTMLRATALENWSSTSAASDLELWVQASGSTTSALAATFAAAGLTLPGALNAANGTFSGTLFIAATGALQVAAGATPTWGGTPAGGNQLVNKTYCDGNVAGAVAGYLPLAGGTMTGALVISATGALTIAAAAIPTWTGTPAGANQLTNKSYVDGAIAAAAYLPLAGGTLSAALVIDANAATTALPPANSALLRVTNADGVYGRAVLDTFLGTGAANSAWSHIALRFARGSAASSGWAPPQSGDELGRISWHGPIAAGGAYQSLTTLSTLIRATAIENWSSTAAGTNILINTTAAGSAAGALRATFDVNFTITGVGIQPGGGSWTAPSDRRLKQDVAAYTRGLAAIRRLAPITWRYRGLAGENPDTWHHGLAAEDVAPIMPEMCGRAILTLAGADEPTEIATLNSTALTFALVNAVRELADRVAVLEAGA